MTTPGDPEKLLFQRMHSFKVQGHYSKVKGLNMILHIIQPVDVFYISLVRYFHSVYAHI